MKTIQDCIQFANVTQVCYLATCDDDQPRVRALGLWFADETGFYFQTASLKDVSHELTKNPKTEVCFYKHAGVTGPMLRVAGKIEILTDLSIKERALADRPFLKTFGLTAESPELVVFRIAHGEAYFWTMEDNMKPKEKIIF